MTSKIWINILLINFILHETYKLSSFIAQNLSKHFSTYFYYFVQKLNYPQILQQLQDKELHLSVTNFINNLKHDMCLPKMNIISFYILDVQVKLI